MSEVTQILEQIETGDPSAAEQLLPLVYEELRKLAAAKMAQERSDHTLQATALVHEAYVRLVDVDQAQHWESRGHFFVAAAEAMRRILIEQARRKKRLKRGGGGRRLPLHEADATYEPPLIDILAVDEALERLAAEDPRKAKIVQLHFFAGLTHEEVGNILGVAAVTVKRDWRYARVWLHREMQTADNRDSANGD